MKLQFISIIAIFILFICVGSCQKSDENEIEESDNYIFIEQHTATHGEHISGSLPPLIMIDFPTYNYDTETKILTGIIDFEINKNLKLVYGSGTCLSGTAGGGCGTGLSAVYAIPYERGNFELLKTDADGSIIAIYKDEVVNIAVGEEWILETIRKDTMEFDGQTSITEITNTERITNFGILSKSDITSWEW